MFSQLCSMSSSVLLQSRELRTLSQTLSGKSESPDSPGNFIVHWARNYNKILGLWHFDLSQALIRSSANTYCLTLKMSFMFGSRPQPSSAEKIAAAEAEIEMINGMVNRYHDSFLRLLPRRPLLTPISCPGMSIADRGPD